MRAKLSDGLYAVFPIQKTERAFRPLRFLFDDAVTDYSFFFSSSIIASSSSTEALAMRSSLFLGTDGAAGFGAGAGADARLLRNGVSPRFRASSGELASWLPR